MTNTKHNPLHKLLFIITTCFFWFSLYAYIPELSTYANTLGASYKLIGLIVGSYGLTQMLIRIPLGIFSDMIGKKKIFIIIGLSISAISALITFLNPSPFSLLTTRLLTGVSASTWVIYTVMFSNYFKQNEAPKAIGLMNSYNAVGQLVAMITGGIISYYYGTRYLFLLASLGAVLGLLFSFTIVEENITKKKIHFNEFIDVLKDSPLQIFSILGILSQIITFATIFGFVPILAKNLGAKDFQLSLLTLLAVIPAILVSRLSSTYFLKHFGIKTTIYIGFSISALLCVILPWINSLWLLYIVQFASGIGRSIVFPVIMGQSIQHIEPEKRATAMGVFQSTYGIGMILGPILLGYIAQFHGLTIGFFVISFSGLIGIIITKLFVNENISNN